MTASPTAPATPLSRSSGRRPGRDTPRALTVAVFGGLLADTQPFVRGVHTGLLIAAAVLALTTRSPCPFQTIQENS